MFLHLLLNHLDCLVELIVDAGILSCRIVVDIDVRFNAMTFDVSRLSFCIIPRKLQSVQKSSVEQWK